MSTIHVNSKFVIIILIFIRFFASNFLNVTQSVVQSKAFNASQLILVIFIIIIIFVMLSCYCVIKPT